MNRNTDFIPFARPQIGPEEEAAVLEVLRSGWLSTAGKAAEFEQNFADYVGARHALALNSATAGLHLALEGLNVPAGSVVAVPTFTFAATAEVCRYIGAHPLLVDVQEDTLNIDPDTLREAFRNAAAPPGGIIPVHIAGLSCDMAPLEEIARSYSVPLIEDAAHAFPVQTPSGWLGTLGDAGVFSFYATKTITTGEGGMIVTDRDDIAERVRILRLHGIDRQVWDRYRSKQASWEYDIVAPGYKYNMPDSAAAIGIEQLKKAEAFCRIRKNIARTYLDRFRGHDFLRCPVDSENHSWHLFILRTVPEKLKIDRDRYIRMLHEAGIGVSVHFKPLHLMTYYKREYSLRPEHFPAAARAYETCISLPIYPGLSEEQAEYIAETVIAVGKEHYRRTV